MLIDPTGTGQWLRVWEERQPTKKTDFVEYAFDDAYTLHVPGDFNSQRRELTYFEGTVWYKKTFTYVPAVDKRIFLYFGAVNYKADVYVNGEWVGDHEGGFTPFQFEVTNKIKAGKNALVVQVNNQRQPHGIPGLGYDWLNYGGITRDVYLIETDQTFIEDYHIQLQKGSLNQVSGWVKLNGPQAQQRVTIEIPEIKLRYNATTNLDGFARLHFPVRVKHWSPDSPKRYHVSIQSATDNIVDTIGFRSIAVQETQVLLNGKPVFLKAVNIHEENPEKAARAYSTTDALLLLREAKALGCNLVRLVHYPHHEHMVKEAEKMGLMVWSELPVYQHIAFSDQQVPAKLATMLEAMIHRDRNRSAVVIWSLSNETYPGTADRNKVLIDLTKKSRMLDSTRLIVHVANTQHYHDNTMTIRDTLYHYSDLVAINEYIGWYIPWQGKPSEVAWDTPFANKPLFIAEFGGEAMAGSEGPTDEAAYWTEAYQADIYSKQIEMFKHCPNLCGVCPWILFDYKSPGRMHPVYQRGYNRKGLVSEKGIRKKAWYVMSDYYSQQR